MWLEALQPLHTTYLLFILKNFLCLFLYLFELNFFFQVGRYEQNPLNKMFDFSASKVEESLKESLKKLQIPYVDLIQVKKVYRKTFTVPEQCTILIAIIFICTILFSIYFSLTEFLLIFFISNAGQFFSNIQTLTPRSLTLWYLF